jgi:hypothetical protein
MSVTDEGRVELIKQEEANIDESFFADHEPTCSSNRFAQGDKKSAELLLAVQNDLLEHTELGRKLKKSASETQAAMNDLKALSEKGLTREDLIQLLLNAPSELYLQTAVSMARPALDYIFFQTLTERLEKSDGEEKRALIDLRDKLIKLTQEIDKAVQEHTQNTLALLDELMNSPDTAKALEEAPGPKSMNFFVQLVQSELQQARKKSESGKGGKRSKK